jgi:hypothetical protein
MLRGVRAAFARLGMNICRKSRQSVTIPPPCPRDAGKMGSEKLLRRFVRENGRPLSIRLLP